MASAGHACRSPAQQLKSVAVRYRAPWAGARPLNGQGWLLAATAAFPAPATARQPGARDARLARVEAVLFVAREALSSRKIAQFASLADGTEARTLIRRLNRWYDTQGTAFRVEEIAGGFQLLSRPKFGSWLRRLHQSSIEARLSSPAMETLAVIAYRQPVLRADIEAIRGVQCGEMLRQLMERDLVRIVGKSTDLGRPFLYGTTRRFLQIFGLRDLEELPRADVLRGNVLPENLPNNTQVAACRADDNPPNHAPPIAETTDSPDCDPDLNITDQHANSLPDDREEPKVKVSRDVLTTLDEQTESPSGAAGALATLLPVQERELESALDEDEDEDEDLVDDDDDDDADDDADDDDDDDDEEDLEDDEWEEVDDEDEEWDDEDEDEDDDDDDDDDDDWDDDDEEEEDVVEDEE
jgi:segregation and condensation protein B